MRQKEFATISTGDTTAPRTSEYTPQERARFVQLSTYVKMRWLAAVAITIATWIASSVFDIGFPTLPVYVLCGVIALYNTFFYWLTRSLKTARTGLVIRRAQFNSNLQVFVDLLTLTALLHYTGGIENPFIFFYLFHGIAAGVAQPRIRAYALTTSALCLASLLVLLEYFEVIPHINLVGFSSPDLYRQPTHVLAVLVTLGGLLYMATYITTAVSGEVRKRQQQVVELRDQLLQKRTEELEQASTEVLKLQEEKRRFVRFLSVVAHDLQAPLAAAQSNLWLILDGYTGAISDEQRDLLKRASHRIDGLLALITDLLDIPRIETGQLVKDMTEISLNEVLTRSVEGLSSLARQKKMELAVRVPEQAVTVRGSSQRLEQVINNLLSNAIKFTPEGVVYINLTDDATEVTVSVTDSGIGVPPEDLPRLFEDFFRGSNAQERGTGLGLSISKRIIEAHSGRIWVESPVPGSDKGSRFSFALPKPVVS